MSVLAVIPARGGSRGVPRKNLALVAGRPLLAWTVDAALHANRVDRVVVSSDDEEVLCTASNLGAEALLRPEELATDHARSESVVSHALDVVVDAVDVVVLLQPTSPLRTSDHIDDALTNMMAGVDAVISVVEPTKSPFKAFYQSDAGYLVPVAADPEAPFVPRQTLPASFFPNGAIYAVRAEAFRRHSSFLPPATVPFLMDEVASLDVDTTVDLEIAGQILAGHKPAEARIAPRSGTEPMSKFFKVS